MKKIGITGQAGFIGTHLFNTLALEPDKYKRTVFHKDFFDNDTSLDAFVTGCDVIVHLAGMNRHNDPGIIYKTNIGLAEKLIDSLKRTNQQTHIIFASSTQEEKENLYGKSKKEARELFTNWAEAHGGKFTGLIIPNVFGPFGNPYYNSVVATFCHQLSHNEVPKIEVDGEVKLIYVGELVNEIIQLIKEERSDFRHEVKHTSEIKVSKLLTILEDFQANYLLKGIIPALTNTFELNLFNTFRSYMEIKSVYPMKILQHTDARGSFMEIIRLNSGGQVSFSTTLPGVTRGNHFHTRKIERFTVIKGEAVIQLRCIGTEEVINFNLSGNEPAYVDMPVWYTHNITNVGKEDLYTVFWINEFYKSDDPDTYYEVM